MKMLLRVAALAALSVLVLVPTAAQADRSFYEGPIFGSTTAGSSLLVADAGRGVVNGDNGALVAALPGVDDVAVRSGGGLWATTGAGEDPEEDTGQGVWRISGSSATLVANLFEYEEKVNPHPDSGLEPVRRRRRGRRKGARRGRGRQQPPARERRQQP